MNDLNTLAPADCIIATDSHRCRSYAPGHNMHAIHAKHVGLSPWGWRDAVIASLTPDGWIAINYVTEDGGALLWNHADLSRLVAPGSPVRVHEGLHALGGSFGWVNVFLASGIGPVPEPEHPQLWAGQMSWGVTNLSTGLALALDHEQMTDQVE